MTRGPRGGAAPALARAAAFAAVIAAVAAPAAPAAAPDSALAAPAPAGAEDLLYLDRPVLDCGDVTRSVQEHLPRLLVAGEADSAIALVEVWRSVCCAYSDLCLGVATRLLVKAWAGVSVDSLLEDGFIEHLVAVREAGGWWCPEAPDDSTQGVTAEEEFCGFLSDLAVLLHEQAPAGSAESFLGRFYGGDRDGAMRALAQGRFPGTRLQTLYDREVVRARREPSYEAAVSADAWVPVGALSRLGAHPGLGLRVGAGSGRWTAFAGAAHRFASAPEEWEVPYADELIRTRRFVNWNLELQGAYRLLPGRVASLDLVAGAGYAGLQFSPGTEEDPGGEWLDTMTWSAGAELRFPSRAPSLLSPRREWFHHLAMQVRWEQTYWSTGGGTDLDGGALVLRLLVGGAGTQKWSRLRALGQEVSR